jgi:hypothetical protein
LGLLLFLPVPIVLWLFTRFPVGILPSLALGTVLMLSHRLYARPFALGRSLRRCLYCGRAAGDGPIQEFREPFGLSTWRCCSEAHALVLKRILGWASRHSLFLRAGILGTLGLYLLGAVLSSRHLLGPVTVEDSVGAFRLLIALTVLPFALLGPFSAPEGDSLPFPLHIQALIGTRWTLWLFRVVGIFWLGIGSRHFLAKAGLL